MTIIEYLSGLTGFVFDKAVLERIALDRDVTESNPADLTSQQKDLLLADLLYTVYVSPNTMASSTLQHGAFTHTVGQQIISDKDQLYAIFSTIYKRYGEEALIESLPDSGLQWME
jgi:hypothetical protein